MPIPRTEHTTTRRRTRPGSPGCAAARGMLFILSILLLLLTSCGNTDPVAKEKARTLTPDERYLVEYYMKVMEFEKYLRQNPSDAEEKRAELERQFDKERIKRTLAELQKRPERWLAIYNRINELQVRALQQIPGTPPTSSD